MKSIVRLVTSSVGKKYLMALSGFILSGFVLGHMCGNLQVFLPPHWINSYAHHLQSMPYGLLWVVRAVMLSAVAIHAATAIVLFKENKAARPEAYRKDATVRASKASRTMIVSGLIILFFIIFHIFHYTVKNMYGLDQLMINDLGHGPLEHPVPNVYAVMYMGFSVWYVALFYIVAVFMLCQHLSHGVASIFQSLGLRNEIWRYRLEKLALAYGWIVFLGFASIPVAVLLDFYLGVPIFDKSTFIEVYEQAKNCAGAIQ
ncbi:MAG: succinate dehydrogenase cytochrome b subunit [Opitutales bacterium]|nr:succinate dehydrogenase cytochrome b subunit [Opitutales bacterium]